MIIFQDLFFYYKKKNLINYRKNFIEKILRMVIKIKFLNQIFEILTII